MRKEIEVHYDFTKTDWKKVQDALAGKGYNVEQFHDDLLFFYYSIGSENFDDIATVINPRNWRIENGKMHFVRDERKTKDLEKLMDELCN